MHFTWDILVLKTRGLVVIRDFCDEILLLLYRGYQLPNVYLNVFAIPNWSYSERKLYSYLKLRYKVMQYMLVLKFENSWLN